jgi:hypothetical protein
MKVTIKCFATIVAFNYTYGLSFSICTLKPCGNIFKPFDTAHHQKLPGHSSPTCIKTIGPTTVRSCLCKPVQRRQMKNLRLRSSGDKFFPFPFVGCFMNSSRENKSSDKVKFVLLLSVRERVLLRQCRYKSLPEKGLY